MPLPGIARAASQTENNNNADFNGVKLVPVKFPLLQPFSAISPKLDLLQMSAKNLPAFDVGNGTSIHQAAKNHGLKYYQVYRHLALINRTSSPVSTPKETLISAAMDAVNSKRLTKHAAAKL